MKESLSIRDKIETSNISSTKDSIGFKTKWKIEKYENEMAKELNMPYEISEFDGNIALNEGINALWTLVCGGSETPFNNTNAQLGVGSDNTSESATQTDLLDSTPTWKGMDSGYPQYGSNQKVVFRSTFGANEANEAWNEFSVRNGASANKNLNRKVSAQGTKISGQVWILTLEISAS
ncbi:MAG: hypothetical protein ABIL39_10770 [candidate division WOR-3 bacterium]